MSDELLAYYNRELSFLRRMASGYAERHPKIAGRLALGADASEDPHVERLIQSFAFLNARTRRKLDDELPELTESLLGVLYPHYQAPVPSMGVVELTLGAEQTELPEGKLIPAGAPIETDPFDEGETVKFRTCYPVTLWPVVVEQVALARPPFPAPPPRSGGVKAVLKLALRHLAHGASLRTLRLGSLRLYLAGQDQHSNLLYELLCNHVLDIAAARHPKEGVVRWLDPKKALHPVGFGPDEGMLPYPTRSFLGYRLLTEFFLFPQKFHFLDLVGLGEALPADVEGRVELYLYLSRAVPDLEPYVNEDAIRLGCTPAVNLYSKRAEPVRLDEVETEYRIAPDARRPLAHEIHTIERVIASSSGGDEVEVHPFFSVRHGGASGKQAFWHSSRRPAEQSGRVIDRGTEVYLSLIDLEGGPSRLAGWTLEVEATCLNRDLPERLPFGGDSLPLRLTEGGGLVSRVTPLVKFTPTFRLGEKRGLLWRLISHLSLNHLSLMDDTGEALREILKLYDFSSSARVQKLISGIRSVTGEADVARPGGVVCRGTRVTVAFDEAGYSANDLYLFASVLERFFALYCTVNSFSRLVAKRGDDKELKRWPPRVGERVLI
jgi:type VI secretion system protein ImpG